VIKLADSDSNFSQLAALLPLSISGDPAMRAAADALSPLLRKTALAAPNLLIFGRMGNQSTESMIASLGRLAAERGGLSAPSTELLERLAWQFHVDFREVARTDGQLAAMVLQSIPWHRIKGTPASLKAAFALFGLAPEIEEDGTGDYWATYQLGLPQIADLETVKLICRISCEMQPARCSLYRIYTDVWDARPGSYDVGFYDLAAYDYYSGVPVPGLPDGGDLLVSFGRLKTAGSLPRLTALLAGRGRIRGVLASEEENFRYDLAFYDTTGPQPNHGFIRSRLRLVVLGASVYRQYFWTGEWDSRQWVELEAAEYARDPFVFAGRSIAAIEGVYDDSFHDDLNTFYEQPAYILVDDPAVYDDSAYDAHDPGRRRAVVDEISVRHWAVHPDFSGARNAFANVRHEETV
jgi:hypothetical protein